MDRVTVRIARAFSGPRHSRLELIWDCIAEWAGDRMVLDVTDNTVRPKSHAQVFQQMWEEEKFCPNRYVLLTEYDFLPDLSANFLPVGELDLVTPKQRHLNFAALACEYRTRHPKTKQLVTHPGNLSGGWWVLIDKERAPHELLFAGKPDPCNQLPDQMDMLLYRGDDGFPFHYGIEYDFGTHLFWSRHYHDDPKLIVAGVELGDMQQRHDGAVSMWLSMQPDSFQAIYNSRV